MPDLNILPRIGRRYIFYTVHSLAKEHYEAEGIVNFVCYPWVELMDDEGCKQKGAIYVNLNNVTFFQEIV